MNTIEAISFFTPHWLQTLIYSVLLILFVAIIIFVIINRRLNPGEKFLLVILCFALPLLGSIIALIYPYFSQHKLTFPENGRRF